MWARSWEWITDLRQQRVPSRQAHTGAESLRADSPTLCAWLKNRMPKNKTSKTRRLKSRSLRTEKPKTRMVRTKSLGSRMLRTRMVRGRPKVWGSGC